ncbi:MAG: hypothetical protein K6A32_03245 [Bacteroidales bacterium]|nr:hypothetical protein [Bacteroidales bacterium]
MNFDRFKNVARWNFAINRSQYLKLALGLFLFMSMPYLLFIIRSIFTLVLFHDTSIALATLPGEGMTTWMWACFLFAVPILCGYTFHNLLTRQSRIKELTLPASSGEKFLFHALVTVGGALLTYVVSFFVIDLLQYLTVGLIYGFSYARWLPFTPLLFTRLDGALVSDNYWMQVIVVLSWVAFFSTFVLGNALKYRHNVIWTFLFHWVLNMIMMVVLGLVSVFVVETGTNWLDYISEWQFETLVKVVLVAVPSLVTVFCWWMSYRLYTRAQLTTLRNK